MGKLIHTTTTDGLTLHGYYAPDPDHKVAVLYIHGLGGNFYDDKFIPALCEKLEENSIGFLTLNTRGHDLGSRYELLEEAHLDISAGIELLIKEGYKQIVLSGHSLGTLKVVRYFSEGEHKDKVTKLILLSPFDQHGCMVVTKRFDIDTLLRRAQKKVTAGLAEELISQEFDDITISYKTFISWNKQNEFNRCFEFSNPEYDFPALKKINVPTKVIVGSLDEFFHQTNPEHPEEAMSLLLRHIPNSKGKIIKEATHSYENHETELALEVVSFISKDLTTNKS